MQEQLMSKLLFCFRNWLDLVRRSEEFGDHAYSMRQKMSSISVPDCQNERSATEIWPGPATLESEEICMEVQNWNRKPTFIFVTITNLEYDSIRGVIYMNIWLYI